MSAVAEVDLTGLLSELTARFRVPAAQLVVLHQGRLDSAACGEPDAAFPLGSLTKPFTAALATLLVSDGELGLDDPVAEHIPGTAASLTLRRLLTHTSGMPANVVDDLGDRARWVARHCGDAGLAHPGGWAFSYSNAGYLLAGHLVERLTGMTWTEALETMLCDPLGIVPAYVTADRPSRPVVPGHAVESGSTRVRVVPRQQLPRIEEPTGSLALSASDVVAFARQFVGAGPGGGPAVDQSTAGLMTGEALDPGSVSPFGLADGWALGWARYGAPGERPWWGHDGTGDGTSCNLRFDPDGASVVCLTTNATTGVSLWPELVRRLREAGIPVADHPVSSLRDPAPAIAGDPAWIGRYRNGDADLVVEAIGGGALGVRLGGRELAPLRLHADGRFVLRAPGGWTHAGRFLHIAGRGDPRWLQISGRLSQRC